MSSEDVGLCESGSVESIIKSGMVIAVSAIASSASSLLYFPLSEVLLFRLTLEQFHVAIPLTIAINFSVYVSLAVAFRTYEGFMKDGFFLNMGPVHVSLKTPLGERTGTLKCPLVTACQKADKVCGTFRGLAQRDDSMGCATTTYSNIYDCARLLRRLIACPESQTHGR